MRVTERRMAVRSALIAGMARACSTRRSSSAFLGCRIRSHQAKQRSRLAEALTQASLPDFHALLGKSLMSRKDGDAPRASSPARVGSSGQRNQTPRLVGECRACSYPDQDAPMFMVAPICSPDDRFCTGTRVIQHLSDDGKASGVDASTRRHPTQARARYCIACRTSGFFPLVPPRRGNCDLVSLWPRTFPVSTHDLFWHDECVLRGCDVRAGFSCARAVTE